MRTFICVFLLSLITLTGIVGCGPAHKNLSPEPGQLRDIKKLAVVVEQKGDFEVIHSRATADSTAGVMFGLIGVAIAGGIDEGEDKDRAAKLAPSISELSCCSLFANSLAAISSASRFETVQILSEKPDKNTQSKFDAVVTFEIQKWGLRIVASETGELSGFVELNMNMKTTADNKTIWDQRHVVIGQGQELFNTYSLNAELLRNELRQTIEQAASRMSNLLIYQ